MNTPTDLQYPVSFYSSNNSHAGKARRWMWWGMLAGVVVVVMVTKGDRVALLMGVILMFVVLLPLEWLFRRQMRPGKPLVTLDDSGIQSPVLLGKEKNILWREIAGISIESNQNRQNFLKFQLTDTPAHPNQKSWFGQNSAQPVLGLHVFSDDDQQALMAALNQGLAQCRRQDSSPALVVVDTLAAERALEEKLKGWTPVPWVTYTLVALNVLIWGATVVQGGGIDSTSTELLFRWGGNATSEVQRGEWWRLLTATFLHGGLMHLLMNMLGLMSMGTLVERIYGPRQYVLLYLAAGLVGSALSLHYAAQAAVSVGASGAIFGLMGALFFGVYQHREHLPATFSKNMMASAALFIVYSLLQGFSKQGIDNAAHIGGLLGGALLAYMLPNRFDMPQYLSIWKKRAALSVLLTLLVMGGLSSTAPVAAVDQQQVFQGQAAFQLAVQEFQEAFKVLQQEVKDTESQQITAREADERSRSILAPMFRKAQQSFAKAYLPPNDPRLPVLNDMKRMNDLLLESVEMESTYPEGDHKPIPVNPQRYGEITAEIEVLATRIQQTTAALKANKR